MEKGAQEGKAAAWGCAILPRLPHIQALMLDEPKQGDRASFSAGLITEAASLHLENIRAAESCIRPSVYPRAIRDLSLQLCHAAITTGMHLAWFTDTPGSNESPTLMPCWGKSFLVLVLNWRPAPCTLYPLILVWRETAVMQISAK